MELLLLLHHRCALCRGVQRTIAIELAPSANTPKHLRALSLSHSLRPPGKPPLRAYLINTLAIFSTFVIQLRRIHFTVCALLTSERAEQSELRTHNSLSQHKRWHLPKWQLLLLAIVACDCCSWRTVSWPTQSYSGGCYAHWTQSDSFMFSRAWSSSSVVVTFVACVCVLLSSFSMSRGCRHHTMIRKSNIVYIYEKYIYIYIYGVCVHVHLTFEIDEN